jgi:hypothetical protein
MSLYGPPTVAEKKVDLGIGASVVQAYLNLVTCIATHRDRHTMYPAENTAYVWPIPPRLLIQSATCSDCGYPLDRNQVFGVCLNCASA